MLAAALATVVVLLGTWNGPAETEGPSPEVLSAVKVEVANARKAVAAQDFAAAVKHFEAALAIYPSPKLYYNIGVCHHGRAMAAEPGTAEHTEARDAAIASYNKYLELAPDADDVDAVEASVVGLGGRPYSRRNEDWTPELVHPDDVPDPPTLADPLLGVEEPIDPADDPTVPLDVGPPQDDSSSPQGDPQGDPQGGDGRGRNGASLGADTGPVNPARLSLGAFIPLMITAPGQLAGSDELSSAPMIGFGFRGGGFLGDRRRINLGGEVALTGQPLGSSDRHIVTSGWLGLTLRYGHPIGERIELGGGGLIAATGQNLRYTGSDPLRCGVRQSGAISSRTGVLLGARFVFAALLGNNKRHVLSLRVTPALAAHGPGTAGQDEGDASMDIPPCREEPTPFEGFGLEQGASFSLVTDFGYAVRL